jgi:hypothetical protein
MQPQMIPVGDRHPDLCRVRAEVQAQETFSFAPLHDFHLPAPGNFQIQFPRQAGQRRNEGVRDELFGKRILIVGA